MSDSFDFEGNSHQCEIVIPIILKIPVYIEPIVIEKRATCYGQKFEPKEMRSQSKVEPVQLQYGTQSLKTATAPSMNKSSYGLGWKKLPRTITKARRSFNRAVRNLFAICFPRRKRLSQ